jgi:hypothetical protein
MIVTANVKPVVVRVKRANQVYSSQNLEADGVSNAFDEVNLAVGSSWTSSDGDVVLGVSEQDA